jgi:hypothetical protein
LNLDETEGT